MADVALLQCESYSLVELKKTISDGLALLAFPMHEIRGRTIALKPNLLSAVSPDTAVITHPVFFQAAAEIMLDHGARPILIESPAVSSLAAVMKASGYSQVVERLGIPVADTSIVAKITNPEAKRFKTFEIAQAFFDCEMIINLPKFKTHGLTYTTGAVKNFFGTVPGMRKSEMHLRFPDNIAFAESILDLYGAFLKGFDPPRKILHIMDAITCLEGDGPGTSGKPKKVNAVLAGTDGLAVDCIATKVSGLSEELSTLLTLGYLRGYGVTSEHDIRVLGKSIHAMQVKGFVPSAGQGMTGIIRLPFVKRILTDFFMSRPMIDDSKCTACCQCVKICPVQAMAKASNVGQPPRFDYSRCIRCFCCMEACTDEAIFLKKGMLQWLIR